MKPGEFVRSFLLGRRSWEQFSIVLARVSLGVFFAISGANKLFIAGHTRQMYQTLVGARIPFPHFMTYFVSSVEFVGGCLLVVGFLSSLCCVALIFQMAVAIATVQLATIPTELAFLNWLDDFRQTFGAGGHIHDGCAEALPERRQRYVDDGAIDKSHAGAENSGGEDPRPHFRCARCVSTHGPDYGFIAWRFHEH